MSVEVECDGFKIEFKEVVNAFIFDEKDKKKTNTYHGMSHAMKAVDIIVELPDAHFFIEIKNFNEPEKYRESDKYQYLLKTLKYKYRDSWLYYRCEDKINKPIKYICLLELETPLLIKVTKDLKKQLPVSRAGPRWQQEICNSCAVINLALWKERFPDWPITQL
jgi:hypothetical protein